MVESIPRGSGTSRESAGHHEVGVGGVTRVGTGGSRRHAVVVDPAVVSPSYDGSNPAARPTPASQKREEVALARRDLDHTPPPQGS